MFLKAVNTRGAWDRIAAQKKRAFEGKSSWNFSNDNPAPLYSFLGQVSTGLISLG